MDMPMWTLRFCVNRFSCFYTSKNKSTKKAKLTRYYCIICNARKSFGPRVKLRGASCPNMGQNAKICHLRNVQCFELYNLEIFPEYSATHILTLHCSQQQGMRPIKTQKFSFLP